MIGKSSTIDNSYTYDAEGRISVAAGYFYTYDGLGNRAAKWTGTTGHLYWHGEDGSTLNETDLYGASPSRNIFAAGAQIARQDPTGAWSYFLNDHLGSPRITTNASGTVTHQVDYFPFGGKAYESGSSSDLYGFTGY